MVCVCPTYFLSLQFNQNENERWRRCEKIWETSNFTKTHSALSHYIYSYSIFEYFITYLYSCISLAIIVHAHTHNNNSISICLGYTSYLYSDEGSTNLMLLTYCTLIYLCIVCMYEIRATPRCGHGYICIYAVYNYWIHKLYYHVYTRTHAYMNKWAINFMFCRNKISKTHVIYTNMSVLLRQFNKCSIWMDPLCYWMNLVLALGWAYVSFFSRRAGHFSYVDAAAVAVAVLCVCMCALHFCSRISSKISILLLIL